MTREGVDAGTPEHNQGPQDTASLMREIDEENKEKIRKMSAEEVAAAQKELMAALSPSILDALKRRGQSKTSIKRPYVWLQLDGLQRLYVSLRRRHSTAATTTTVQAMSVDTERSEEAIPTTHHIGGDSHTYFASAQALEEAKLEWQKPIGADEEEKPTAALRFGLNGTIIAPDTGNYPT